MLETKPGQIYQNPNNENELFIVTQLGLSNQCSIIYVDGSTTHKNKTIVSKCKLVAEYPNYMSALMSDEWKENCEHWNQAAIEPDPNSLKELMKRAENKLCYDNMMKDFDKLQKEKDGE